MIRFDCPCGRTIQVRDDLAGGRGRCTKCQRVIRIPQAGETDPGQVVVADVIDPEKIDAQTLAAEFPPGSFSRVVLWISLCLSFYRGCVSPITSQRDESIEITAAALVCLVVAAGFIGVMQLLDEIRPKS